MYQGVLKCLFFGVLRHQASGFTPTILSQVKTALGKTTIGDHTIMVSILAPDVGPI